MVVSTAPNEEPLAKHFYSRSQLAAALASVKTTTYPEPSPTSSRSAAASSSATTSVVRDLAWSPLGDFIAVSDQRSLRVWIPERPNIRFSTELKVPASAQPTPASGPGARKLPAPAGSLGNTVRVAWDPECTSELVSLGADGIVRFWDVRARGPGMLVGTVDVGGQGVSLTWRPPYEVSGEFVVGRTDDTLCTISKKTMSVVSQTQQPSRTNHISFENSGERMLLPMANGQVRLAEYPSYEVIHAITGHTSSCNVAKQCPRGLYIAVGGSDALVTLWDAKQLLCTRSLPSMSVGGPIRSLSWSHDGVYLIAGSDEGGVGIQVAHASSGEIVATLPVANDSASPIVAWHPQRYVVAYGGGDAGGMRVIGLSNTSL